MDVKTFMACAALAIKENRDELALEILRSARKCQDFEDCVYGMLQQRSSGEVASVGCDGMGIDGFNSYVTDKHPTSTPGLNSHVGVPASENTIAPSLHGNDQVAFAKVVAVASAVSQQRTYLTEGDEIILDPHIEAVAADVYDDLDDNELVAVASSQVKPGRIRIQL